MNKFSHFYNEKIEKLMYNGQVEKSYYGTFFKEKVNEFE